MEDKPGSSQKDPFTVKCSVEDLDLKEINQQIQTPSRARDVAGESSTPKPTVVIDRQESFGFTRYRSSSNPDEIYFHQKNAKYFAD